MERSENDKQLLKEDKGATSIFVMILMVVLIVFGLAALTTSLASLKLSNKNSTWTKEYYLLEAIAEECVARIDQQLIKSEKVARNSASTKEQFHYEYYDNLLIEMQKLNKEMKDVVIYSELLSYVEWEALDNKSINISFTVQEAKAAYPKNITVDMQLLFPQYDDSTKPNLNRFKIIKWQEWQNAFVYDQDIDFENPDFENPEFELE